MINRNANIAALTGVLIMAAATFAQDLPERGPVFGMAWAHRHGRATQHR